MKQLERQYRSSLRWYPRKWRERHEEALLETLLAGAEAEGRTRPTNREKFDLASMGLQQRVARAAPFALFGVAMLGLLAVLSVLGVSPGNYVIFHLPVIPAPPPGQLYTTFAMPFAQAFWIEIVGSVVFILGTVLGGVLLRRSRRARNASAPKSTQHG